MPTNRLAEKEKIATYASVLFDGALAAGGQEAVLQVRDQAEQVIRVMRSNVDLTDALKNTAFSAEQRNELAREVFKGFNPVLIDLLAVMTERGDSALLARVWVSYEGLIQSKLNVTIVDVTTVVELDNHLRDSITKKAAKDLGTDVVLREHIDKSILGGIVMSANGKRIDASVLTQLESARSVLKQSADGGEC